MTFSKAIIVTSHVPVLAAVCIAAFRYQKLGRSLKVFSYFVFLSGFIQFLSLLFWFTRRNNLPLLHFYVAAGFVCLVWFYTSVLGNFVNSFILWVTAALFVVFSLINTLFFQNIYTFNSNALVIESILVVILALFTFTFFLNDSMKESEIADRRKLSWINSGLFIYYLSCLLLFYLGASIIRDLSLKLNRLTWIFHSFFSMVMYTCFIIGLWKNSKTNY